jgi:carbonic anhydrase
MSSDNILNLQVKDESLKDIVYNNPYYIDIKGSVNICLIRCGQEIDSCKSITFSTMTNYGKILVLNPNNSKIGKCAIKLAYDTSNDNKDNNGNANYQFVKAFVTVPSLHKLNGQIYDMETFLVFSSVQKNGNILYVVLCTLSNGTPNVPQTNDPTLLNYKLLTELFTKNNIIPEIYGTKEIKSIPNPVDLSSFIPPLGLRSFYDYTHPLNNKVNFRVFQKVMNVGNDVLTNLRSKLTPGLTYDNFKSSILKTINPFEGLFFYFSEDLTNRYKSFEVNKKKEKFESNIPNNFSKKDEKLDEISKNIIEEQEKYENDEFKKIDIQDKNISKFDKIEEEEIKKSEKFEDISGIEKLDIIQKYKENIIMIYSAIICLFLYNIIHTYLINNLFKSQIKPSNENLALSIVNLGNNNISALLGTKFKMYIILFIQGLLTFGCFLTSMILLSTNNILSGSITNILLIIILLILIIGIIVFYLNIRYVFLRFKTLTDNSLTYKVNFLFTHICNKMFSSNNISIIINNLYNIFITENYNNFNVETKDNVIFNVMNVMKGGSYIPSVPAPYVNDDKDLLNALYMEKINKTNSFMDLLDLFGDDYLKDKLSNNRNWFRDIFIYSSFIIISFIIIVYKFQYNYIMTNNYNVGLNTVTNLAIVIFTYKGLLLLFSALACYLTTNKFILYIILIVIVLASLSSIVTGFIPTFPGTNEKIIKIPFYLYICFVGIAFLLISSLFVINLLYKKPEPITEGGEQRNPITEKNSNNKISYNLFTNDISPKISVENKKLLEDFVDSKTIDTIEDITPNKIKINNNNKKTNTSNKIKKILRNKYNNTNVDNIKLIKEIIINIYPDLENDLKNIKNIEDIKNILKNKDEETKSKIDKLIELLSIKTNIGINEENIEKDMINNIINQNPSNESLKEFLTCIKDIIVKLKEINEEKNKARRNVLLSQLEELKKNINATKLNEILKKNSELGKEISVIYEKVINGINEVIKN